MLFYIIALFIYFAKETEYNGNLYITGLLYGNVNIKSKVFM
jgi:hypothetical protein